MWEVGRGAQLSCAFGSSRQIDTAIDAVVYVAITSLFVLINTFVLESKALYVMGWELKPATKELRQNVFSPAAHVLAMILRDMVMIVFVMIPGGGE